jgi:ABC-type multidrug transport system ATPase subunit
MGPSGCGKTTLLNVLARRDNSGARLEGTTLINGTSPPIASFRQLTSYVEQEDALIGSLTVKETMKFAAKLTNAPYVLSQ